MARLLWLLVIATACSGGSHGKTNPGDDGSPPKNKPGFPAVLEQYRQGHEIQRWDRYTVTGFELWQLTLVGVADKSSSSVVGVGPDGTLVRGFELFKQVGDLAPAELVGRAMDMLYGKATSSAIMSADDAGTFFSAEQRALVEPPALADGALVFWTVFGEMAPRLTRVRLDLSTGKDERTWAEHVLNPPPDPLPPIRALLGSDDAKQVVEGLILVSEHCALAADVAALLRHADAHVRSIALDVLGNLGDPATVADIIRLMREGLEWSDRSLAGQKLLYFPNHPDALDALRQHVATAKGQEVSILRDAIEYNRNNPIAVGNRPCAR